MSGPRPREDVTLRSGRAERFKDIRDAIEERRGHDVDNTSVMDELMDEWETDNSAD
ncbi:hypothetical protein [Halostella sp. PRR32]|uniref:hypothetical protein n=1 Tax=Halostella sp. PRR32 TaxID=3098147 RepID=UPI002B1D93C4|nr:hypothetical protein [Halostella sp. PRR32]